jgi:hypothetical protein
VGATAVILLTSIWTAWQRIAYLQSQMGIYTQKEANSMVLSGKLMEQTKQSGTSTLAAAARAASLGAYYCRMTGMYQWAVLFFWLAIPPDPSPP